MKHLKFRPSDDPVVQYQEGSVCLRKINYGKKNKAIRAAVAMAENTEHNFAAYECAFCCGWHIGKDRDSG